jgi:hypothetical protein
MTEPETIPKGRFVWPADYYSAPTPEAAVPRGVAYGCGIASAFVLLIVFAGGALLSGGALNSLVDLTVGVSVGKMREQYTKSVPEPRRKSLEAEIERLRDDVRNERVSIGKLQPFLQALSDTISDSRVTPEEAQSLEEVARKITPLSQSQSRTVSQPHSKDAAAGTAVSP